MFCTHYFSLGESARLKCCLHGLHPWQCNFSCLAAYAFLCHHAKEFHDKQFFYYCDTTWREKEFVKQNFILSDFGLVRFEWNWSKILYFWNKILEYPRISDALKYAYIKKYFIIMIKYLICYSSFILPLSLFSLLTLTTVDNLFGNASPAICMSENWISFLS